MVSSLVWRCPVVARLSSVSSAVWSGFRSGGLAGFAVRPSSHSSSGWVVAVFFSSPRAAGRFAARAARRAGVSVVVRSASFASGSLVGWAVSVPVPAPAPVCVAFAPSGVGFPVAGGFRGVAGVSRLLVNWAGLAAHGLPG